MPVVMKIFDDFTFDVEGSWFQHRIQSLAPGMIVAVWSERAMAKHLIVVFQENEGTTENASTRPRER